MAKAETVSITQMGIYHFQS